MERAPRYYDMIGINKGMNWGINSVPLPTKYAL
jgi:hypothetical protein